MPLHSDRLDSNTHSADEFDGVIRASFTSRFRDCEPPARLRQRILNQAQRAEMASRQVVCETPGAAPETPWASRHSERRGMWHYDWLAFAIQWELPRRLAS